MRASVYFVAERETRSRLLLKVWTAAEVPAALGSQSIPNSLGTISSRAGINPTLAATNVMIPERSVSLKMAERWHPIPAKLKDDAIVEAVVEIRFDMPTRTIPEILFGRLAEYEPWKGFEQHAMPASQIPLPLRKADPNLRYQPVFELAAADKRRTVRIGPQVLSYHRLSPYVGWASFKPELNEAIDGLFANTGGVSVRRLGLRYMNALRSDVHQIRSILDLDLNLSIAGERSPEMLTLISRPR